MANIIERSDGSTCTDPWPNYPFPPRMGPFIPGVFVSPEPPNELAIESDVTFALASMKEDQRRSTLEALIRTAMQRRTIAVPSETISDTAKLVAEHLDTDRLREAAGPPWKPDSMSVKMKYDGKKFGTEVLVTWKF